MLTPARSRSDCATVSDGSRMVVQIRSLWKCVCLYSLLWESVTGETRRRLLPWGRLTYGSAGDSEPRGQRSRI